MKKGKQESNRDPFVLIDVRAVIDSTPEEMAVLLALQLLHWWLGPGPKGLEAIVAVLVNPDQPTRVKAGVGETKEGLSQISERGIKRALARLKARGWVDAPKGFGTKTAYVMTVPPITYNEVYAQLKGRMSLDLRAFLFPHEKPDTTPDLFTAAGMEPAAPAPAAPPAPSVKVAPAWQAAQDELWAHFKAEYVKRFPGKTPTWPTGKWVGPKCLALVNQHGMDEMKQRAGNLAHDPLIPGPTFEQLLYTPDRWIARRADFTKGTPSARAFHAPKTNWRPSAPVAPPPH